LHKTMCRYEVSCRMDLMTAIIRIISMTLKSTIQTAQLTLIIRDMPNSKFPLEQYNVPITIRAKFKDFRS
jgi:hypothetical protein